MQRSFFDYLATLIQKVYRGYYSRRYKANFYQRQRFLREIVSKGEQLRQDLEEYHVQLRIKEEEAANIERVRYAVTIVIS